MGSVVGAEGHTARGYVGAAIVGSSITLSFKDVVIEDGAIATAESLEVFLTINGSMAKRPIALGRLPDRAGAFDLAVPDGTDISLFNTLIIRPVGTETTVAKASIP